MNKFEEIEAIKVVKHRYFRHLDCKQFDLLVNLFVSDATTSYDNGRHSYTGRDEIYAFLNETMSEHSLLTQHHAHHPEITLTSETTATGVWYMDDTVYAIDKGIKVRGNGIYWDEYVKEGDKWKILHTGYERLWVHTTELDDERTLSMRSLYDKKEIATSDNRQKRVNEINLRHG